MSKEDQVTDLQVDALRAAGAETIYQETESRRPGSNQVEREACLKALRPGDVLIVWRLDRLGGSLSDLVRVVAELERRGIAFVSLTERIETDSPAGRFIFHVFASLAQFERDLIVERTRAGLAAARARGRQGGRPRAMTDRQIQEARILLADPRTRIADVCALFGVCRTTLYRHVGTVRPIRPTV